jgi:hypothetical protein
MSNPLIPHNQNSKPMKKLLATTLLGFAACVSCFAQGNFTFNNTPSSAVWDGYTTPGIFFRVGAVIEVAVMWSTNLTALPTNDLNGEPTRTNGFFYASWNGILTDPNFHLAQSTAAGNPTIVAACGGTGPAAGMYLGGIQYIFGTSPGETIQLYVLGWSKSYGTDPVVAAQNGSIVGWSSVIQYTLGSVLAPGGSLGNAGISGFGFYVPEPGTFTLAGLGAAAVLIFRRRRNH